MPSSRHTGLRAPPFVIKPNLYIPPPPRKSHSSRPFLPRVQCAALLKVLRPPPPPLPHRASGYLTVLVSIFTSALMRLNKRFSRQLSDPHGFGFPHGPPARPRCAPPAPFSDLSRRKDIFVCKNDIPFTQLWHPPGFFLIPLLSQFSFYIFYPL